MEDQRRSIRAGAIIGLAVTIPLAALLYLGQQVAALPMTAFDLLERITRVQQLGRLVTFGIDTMVGLFSSVPGLAVADAAKTAERLMAVVLFLIVGAVMGALVAVLYPRFRTSSGLIIGIAAWVLSVILELTGLSATSNPQQLSFTVVWFGVLYLGWGRALVWALDRISAPGTAVSPAPAAPAPDSSESADLGRRRFLLQFGGTVAVLTLGAWGLGSLFGRRTSDLAGQPIASIPPTVPASSGGTAGSQAATQAANSAAGGAFVPAAGTRSEVTANGDFYRVDNNIAGAPGIDEKTYVLAVTGLVNKPLSLSYDAIRKMPVAEQDATLECISNPVGGDLISSTRWTGVRLRDVLNQAGLKDGVVEIKFSCADGYTESLPLESAMDERTLLVYGMNGQALADIHGFPIRVYTPNRYGMKNPKWLTGIEAINQSYEGYWEVRGWDKQAIVKSTAVIDTVAKDKAQDGVVPVGGIAFAGARGISKVEISVDGGSWQEAELKDPLSPLTWRLWRFDWKATKGHHDLRVRATDGQGALQVADEADTHPNGASGYFSTGVDI